MSASANWSDLPKRISVGVIVAAVVFSVMWYGGWLFVGLVALISAVLVWELVTMVESKSNAVPLAAFAATMLLFSAFVPSTFSLILLALPSLVGFWRLQANQALFAAYAGIIMVAAYGLIDIRSVHGVPCLLWLALVVIARCVPSSLSVSAWTPAVAMPGTRSLDTVHHRARLVVDGITSDPPTVIREMGRC